jgi:hypothetical protein
MFPKTMGWDVPYCSQCLEHIQAQASSPGGNLGGAVLGAVVGGPIGLLIGLGSAASAIYKSSQYQSNVERLLKPSCVAVGPAVAYRGWYQDVHAFTFLNWDFAERFRDLNGGEHVS